MLSWHCGSCSCEEFSHHGIVSFRIKAIAIGGTKIGVAVQYIHNLDDGYPTIPRSYLRRHHRRRYLHSLPSTFSPHSLHLPLKSQKQKGFPTIICGCFSGAFSASSLFPAPRRPTAVGISSCTTDPLLYLLPRLSTYIFQVAFFGLWLNTPTPRSPAYYYQSPVTSCFIFESCAL